MKGLQLLAAAAGACVLSSASESASVVVEPARDATLYASTDGGVANGSGQYMFVGRNSGGNTRRSLLFFDVAGAVPVGSTITSVTLDVRVESTSGGATDVTLHRLLAAWGEGASDPAGTEGGGATSQPGDATWLHTSYDTSLWTTPGGDFDPLVAGSTVIDQPGDYTFASSPGMEADVQAWLDNPGANLGWLAMGEESGPGTAKRFGSHENPDPARRPRLTITYIPAPPTGAALIALAIAGATRRRRTTPTHA